MFPMFLGLDRGISKPEMCKTVQSLAKNLLNQWQEDGVIEPLSELMLVSSSSQLSCDPLGFLK